MERYIVVVFKLILSLLLGGIVGYEREFKNRPAGLRTHVLVCLGATLVQIISIDYYKVNGVTNYDPMRLGAQVISGIGFLGAGTILKEGVNVKGLTTAASIWAVACIGLAVGSGLYFEGIITTLFIYFCLRWFKKIEKRIIAGKRYVVFKMIAKDQPGVIGEIASILGKKKINITNIELEKIDDYYVEIEISTNLLYMQNVNEILSILEGVNGIETIKIKEE
ncbi:MgtC/SapB family protein [Thermobrachium celere]|uniref:Mg(2+) transport ATPase protein C n=1 Tax=Thermobrachium celere DSM 8682 TaxID=941824 RepID=R7RT78_9CLOT|nr:MgtC/SapB family protein [Thermobrachium celere]CDF58455.1 Mg(2+) transport ATPase protein C [Thermobrachium celere DSM 8682]